jgi:hypothetical protein
MLKKVICDFVRCCDVCKRFNSLRTVQPIYMKDIIKKYERYIIDYIDLRKYSNQNDGFTWILNV